MFHADLYVRFFLLCIYFQELFVQENIRYCLQRNAGNLLIDVCLKLPFLSRYVTMTKELFQNGSVDFSSDVSECLAMQEMYVIYEV